MSHGCHVFVIDSSKSCVIFGLFGYKMLFFGLKVGSPTFFIYQIIVAIVEESRSTVYLDFALLPTTVQE